VNHSTIDVLVIGAGAAGARTAIEIARERPDASQLVVGKQDYGDAHTTWARGGINAALANLDDEDRWQIHAADTLNEGHFICDPTAVEMVTEQMPARIRELDEWGMEFTTTDDGDINQRYFGAQSFRRTCYAGDHTGESLLDTLVSKAQSLDIPYREQLYVTEILTDENRAEGAIAFDLETGEKHVLNADTVVLATGGYAGSYDRHSSRDIENNGDSVRLALDAGAAVQDMEFVQFHPTGMSGYGEKWDGRLVTEAVRGEGGRLYNSEGDRFMREYSPKAMELDARDVVARAIQSEIDAGRGTENDAVYLDISHRERAFIKKHLPRMYSRFDSLGVDLAEESVEVAPTAHYSMGGVQIDWETGETSVDNLYALGEAVAGVHGANRLGGNSLAETVAMGVTVGQEIARTSFTDTLQSPPDHDSASLRVSNEPNEKIVALQDTVRRTLNDHAGIRRHESDLTDALETLADVQTQLDTVEPDTTAGLQTYWDTVSMVESGILTLKFARHRTESRGAHYRTDHQSVDTTQEHNLYATADHRIKTSPIGETSETVLEAVEEEHELDYVQLE
jgi:succinate dehydrogenase / fumarate reductase flavoprotein subunit